MKKEDPVYRFSKVFDKWRHKYEPYALFERFMEFVIAGFDQTFSKLDRPFDKEEGTICMEILNEWVTITKDELVHHEWYDLLGEIYMSYMSGTMKKHWTGQYFTPMHISDFMAKIVDAGENAGESVMDNACGSGRMLLAAHANHPTNYCCAQDMDRVCCLMTVCNFIIHGVNGEVVWGDSLDPTDYREGWRTNELLGVIGVPCVRKMDKLESKTYISGISMLQDKPVPDFIDTSVDKKVKSNAKKSKMAENEPVQLSLFDE